MAAVFHNRDNIVIVDQGRIQCVKESAVAEPLRRARLNLHHSADDSVQEMLIAFCYDSLCEPHRHIGKSESLHALEGRARIVFFDDDGEPIQRVEIGGPETGLPALYRLSAPLWHTVIPLDPIVVLHEVASGPFQKNTEPLPSWAPKTVTDLETFIAKLRL